MMLNKASAWVMIFIWNPLTSTYLLIVNNSNTRKGCEICSKLTIKSPQRHSSVFIVNFEYFAYLSTP